MLVVVSLYGTYGNSVAVSGDRSFAGINGGGVRGRAHIVQRRAQVSMQWEDVSGQ